MILPCVTEKHLDGLEVAYENEQLLSFLVKVIKRNRDRLWEDASRLTEELK